MTTVATIKLFQSRDILRYALIRLQNAGTILKQTVTQKKKKIFHSDYLSSFDKIISWVWFDVVCAEKFIKLAMYLKKEKKKRLKKRS